MYLYGVYVNFCDGGNFFLSISAGFQSVLKANTRAPY